jgi:hypothetical protein
LAGVFNSGWIRRRVRVFSAGALIIVLLLLFGPAAAKPFVRAKLQSVIREQLNAELEIGSLAYDFPNGVSVFDARLVANDPQGKPVDLLTARRLSITLAGLPILPGPLRVRSIVIESPSVHLIETCDGLVGRGLTDKPDAQEKLSELFELQRLALIDGSIVYEDRTVSGAVPLVWRGFQIDLKTAARSTADYAFDVTAGAGNAATLAASGSLNIDDLLLHLDRCDVKVRVDPAKAEDSPLPASLQPLLRDYQVSGEIALGASGDVPIVDPHRANVTATLDLPRASGKLPGADAPLDELSMKLSMRAEPLPAGPPAQQKLGVLKVKLDQLLARGRETSVRVEGGNIVLNSTTNAWGASDLKLVIDPGKDRTCLPVPIRELLERLNVSGQLLCTIDGSGPIGAGIDAIKQIDAQVKVEPQDLVVQPRELPLPLREFADATVRLSDGIATVENLRAGYGNDVLLISHAALRIEDLLHDLLRCDRLSGCITLAKQPATYPPPLTDYIAQAKPHGPFWFDGSVRCDLSRSDLAPDYRIRITTDRGAISTRLHHIPLHNVNADLLVTPAAIEINRFDADVLSGKLWTNGHVDLGDSISYWARVRTRGIDLNTLAQFAVEPDEKPVTVSGELDLDMTLFGNGVGGAALDHLRADGALRVLRGELLRVPVIDEIASAVGDSNLATVGEAGCTFKLEDRKIHVTDAAVGSPALGVRGSGDISFDGELALDVIATPLNDWDKKIRRENGSSVRNFVANVAGSVQEGMNKVTEKFLYRLRVGGTIEKPDVSVVAAPALQQQK